MPSTYCLLWRFTVAQAHRDAFVRHYGPDGTWATLFRRADGFLGTSLLADRDDPLVFVTVDRWRSAADHAAFGARFAEDYAALDRACEALTVREEHLGAFDEG